MNIITTENTYILSGNLTCTEQQTFSAIIAACSQEQGRILQLDLSAIEQMDTAGLSLLRIARETAHAAGNTLMLTAISPNVRIMLELAGARDLLPPSAASPTSPEKNLSLEISETETALEIFLAGRFTFASHSTFLPVLDQISRSPGLRIVLDCTNLVFMDSAALSMVLIACDEALKSKSRLEIRGAAGRVRKLMELSDLSAMVDIRDE